MSERGNFVFRIASTWRRFQDGYRIDRLFIVPADISDGEFVRRWHDRSGHLVKKPGFMQTRMHRNPSALQPLWSAPDETLLGAIAK